MRVVVHRTERLYMMREVRAGNSYQSSRTKDIFFGLGSGDVSQMTVHRPSGIVDTVRSVPSNQSVTVREGEGVASYKP